MNTTLFKQQLTSFIQKKLLHNKNKTIHEDTELFEEGLIDSMKIIDLVAFIEDTLNCKISDDEMSMEFFGSINKIADSFASKDNNLVDSLYNNSHVKLPAHKKKKFFPVTEKNIKKELSVYSALWNYFESTFLELAKKHHAIEVTVRPTIEKEILTRSDYFVSFPDMAFRLTDDTYLNPAVCYHVYELLRGTTITKPAIVTSQTTCFRNEKTVSFMKRMYAFTMREIVIVGSANDIETMRKSLLVDVYELLTNLTMLGQFEKAHDPFFVSEKNKGKILSQKMYPLKFELQLAIGLHETIAVSSFNNHQQFFGNRFSIKQVSGDSASSGCVAFGIDRFIYAFLRQYGFKKANWPDHIKNTHVDISQ